MKIIFGGHWRETPEGWVSIPESEQDLRAPLEQPDNSVDVIFTEHVLEHVSMIEAIFFLTQAFRVLKPCGIIRTVLPCLDQMMRFDSFTTIGQNYTTRQTSGYFKPEFEILEEFGLNPLHYGKAFMFENLYKGHGHKMIWTSFMLQDVLSKIGFETVVSEPGYSAWDQDTCQERILRGVDKDVADDLGISLYDPESLAIEARKTIIP